MNSHQPQQRMFFLPTGTSSSQSSPDSIPGSAHQMAAECGVESNEKLSDNWVPVLERLNSGISINCSYITYLPGKDL